jgi:hypothetical protein
MFMAFMGDRRACCVGLQPLLSWVMGVWLGLAEDRSGVAIAQNPDTQREQFLLRCPSDSVAYISSLKFRFVAISAFAQAKL